MSAHDRYLANHDRRPVIVTCGVCSLDWPDTFEEEYGAGWLVIHEECPECGASGEDLRIADDEWEPDYEPEDFDEYGQYEPWV